MLRDKLKEKMSGIQIDENASWQQAKDETLKDSRSPAFRRQRWEEAHEIKAKLFAADMNPKPRSLLQLESI